MGEVRRTKRLPVVVLAQPSFKPTVEADARLRLDSLGTRLVSVSALLDRLDGDRVDRG